VTPDAWAFVGLALLWAATVSLMLIDHRRFMCKVADLADALHRDLSTAEDDIHELKHEVLTKRRVETRVMPVVKPTTSTPSTGKHARID
jgi:hypothetical protein